MFFNGKQYEREHTTPNPNVDHSGAHLQKLIAAEIPKAQANARAQEQMKAADAKRRRVEQRAVNALVGMALQEDETWLQPQK